MDEKKKKQHPYDKWIKMRHAMRESDISTKTLIQKIADFLQKVLPSTTPPGTVTTPATSKIEEHDLTAHPSPSIQAETDSVFAPPSSLPSMSREIIYETSKRSLGRGETEGEVEEKDKWASYIPEKDVSEFSTKHFGSVASPYISSYAYRRRDMDKDFGIRKDADGTFRIGDSIVDLDPDSNVYVQGKMYKGTKGLFELLTRKKLNHSLVTTDDLKNYKPTLI